ncbi:MAG: flagellar assembly protein FliW [Deltaproteobacteria bacterium RIFOXYD12_FULL_57_12]|nr:MAG: flagellar assembly protein FliW [Deltaproteobacteria bacterium RIFOXYD12_FULL_57_12]
MHTETSTAPKKIIHTRFGELEYDPDKTLLFPEGLLGFAALRHFVVMPNQKNGPLFWIQSTEDPEVAFVLTDPTNFFPTYQVAPDKKDCQKLDIKPGGECFTLAVVTVHADRQVTLNLQAPILYAPSANRALQVVLENSTYQVRTPLPEGKK